MAFESNDLIEIYMEIRRRQQEADRLALVDFDGSEYAALLDCAQRIVWVYECWGTGKKKQARKVFLAFAIAFVRRNQYSTDIAFWPDFEEALDLGKMEKRLMMDDLLWLAYQENDLELQRDGRGRRIVGTLTHEMIQTRGWVERRSKQFVEFFKWYYRHHPGEKVTVELVETYRQQTYSSLDVLKKVLPKLTQDCQVLGRVLDFALENELYLDPDHLDEYRRQVVTSLGTKYDPVKLRLVRGERALVSLIRELQNHVTTAQFTRILSNLRSSDVIAPWGDRRPVHQALQRWEPLPYGIYHVQDDAYRVVPHTRLRLETLDDWPLNQVVLWREGRTLGYKKTVPFEATIGRRRVEAIPYVRSALEKFYVWVGEAPIGQKLLIDDRLRPESSGADWQLALQLIDAETDRPALCVAITRLMLYYPERPHQPLRVWTSTGYSYEDTLREDGVRRFHRHRCLVVPLDTFDTSVEVSVSVGGETILHQTFAPEPCYLFSVASRGRVQARSVADLGDREYVLFTRDGALPQTSSSVSIRPLPTPYSAYTVYRVTWEDADQPFELQVGTALWVFQRRREFAVLLESKPSSSHLRLKSHQCLSFEDLSLCLYSTFDLSAAALTLMVYDDEGLLGQIDLSRHVSSTDVPHFFDVDSTVWSKVKALTGEQCSRYLLRFCDGETLLGEQTLSLMPRPNLEGWDERVPHLETEPLQVHLASPDCPIWNPDRQQLGHEAIFQLHPRTQAEPWPGHPALRRIVPQPISALASFPDLGETLEIIVRPCLFGFRLYLKRSERISGEWRTRYQPLSQADYYHLAETVLYIFSAPGDRVELAVGARVVWAGETDDNGDLLIDDLTCLQSVCLDEETFVTLRSGGLRSSFVVRWAPLLQELAIEEQEILLRFNGSEASLIRLWLRGPSGEIFWTQDIPCVGNETTERILLPSALPPLAYIVVGYVLSSGEVRPAAWQVKVVREEKSPIPPEWLLEGIGVTSLDDLASFAA